VPDRRRRPRRLRPSRPGCGVQRPVDHRPGQSRLDREDGIVRDTCGGASLWVVGPGPGQVEVPVDERVPGRGGVGQVDRDLAVLDPSGGAGVLTLHSNGAGALLHVTGLIDHQDRVRVPEVLGDVSAQIIPHAVSVPDCLRQQPLHPARIGVPGMLGDRPAIGPRQARQQSTQEGRNPAPWFDTGEPRPDSQHQLIELQLPSIKVYAGGSSHREISLSLHKPG
jgi:hypothetical protein